MNEIDTFIQQARDKGLDDETIRQNLIDKGWDKASVAIGLAGLEAPAPPVASVAAPNVPASSGAHPAHPSLSPLMAALHHIILWFFTSSSAVTIGGAVATLYDMNVSSSALAAMIAVTLITFIPYAILFSIYLARLRKTPLLIPGKVWSIITICLHSIGAMTAAIVLIVSLITHGDGFYQMSAMLILLLDVIIVTTYSYAAFGFGRGAKVRQAVVWLILPILVVMFGILSTLSLLRLAPIQHDETIRKDLSALVDKVVAKVHKDNELPDSMSDAITNTEISYKKVSTTSYQVCGTFLLEPLSSPLAETNAEPQTDSYVSEGSFTPSGAGKQCFDFTSDYLQQNSTSSPVIRTF